MNIIELIVGSDQWIIYYIFFGIFILQLIYLYGIFALFTFSGKRKKVDSDTPPVSVIICARNEYYSLEKNLPRILEQNYPNFEVIVVNDRSDDDTRDLLNDLSRTYAHLSVVNVENNNNFFYGKKFPLALGIKSAKNDIILLTDADCYPQSNEWLHLMQQRFASPKTNIVLGYGKYREAAGMLNKIIRFDTLWIAIQYFSFAKLGIPYMGVGRNLAYRKSFFNDKKGFVKHYHIPSGDDDLFVNQNAKRKNTQIEYAENAHTISEPMKDYGSWVFQKKRHATTGRFYKFYHLFLLSLLPMSTLGFYGLGIYLLITAINLWMLIIPASLLLFRVISYMLITKTGMRKLREKNFLLLSPFFELFLIIFNMSVIWLNGIKPEKRWK
jgi:cellulose synthase/poly-beta-1,6-N-acetylglucosamine synthase-like glycosyltransferase